MQTVLVLGAQNFHSVCFFPVKRRALRKAPLPSLPPQARVRQLLRCRMWRPMTMSYHTEGVPVSTAIYVSTYTAQAGRLGRAGSRDRGLEVFDHPDFSCAAVSPQDTQMVPSPHWAPDTPGKQGKVSFTTCKDLGAESQNQPHSKMR